LCEPKRRKRIEHYSTTRREETIPWIDEPVDNNPFFKEGLRESAMSRDNVEVVRRAIEANRSDDMEAAIEALVALSDPQIEYTSVMAAVESNTYRGHDGIRRYVRDLADSWQEWRMQAEEVFGVDPDTVIAVFRTHSVGRDSGVAVESRRAAVFALSEGKIVRGRTYPSREEALEAAGLAE
jgi:ketosteroid isomerase-like protein